MSRRRKGSKKSGRKKTKKVEVVIEEEEEEDKEEMEPEAEEKEEEEIPTAEGIDEDQDEFLIEEEGEEEEEVEPEEGEEVWEALVWEDVNPTAEAESPVFDRATVSDIFKEVVDQAWEDGIVTDDEMAMLQVLKKKLDIDDDTFNEIMEEVRLKVAPVPQKDEAEMGEQEEEQLPEQEIEEEEEEEEELPEPEIEEEEEVSLEDLPLPPEFEMPAKPPEQEEVIKDEPPSMITFTTPVRGNRRPLHESFDLSQREPTTDSFKKRCPHCRSLIRVRPEEGKNVCPICGRNVVEEKKETPGLRRILDQAKSAFKDQDWVTAKELYTIALAQTPGNKEAMFYLQKVQHRLGVGPKSGPGPENIPYLKTNVNRLDQLLKGGITTGYQVLLKGPAFCGKEILLDKVMGSALQNGFPVIYVSSNRAMKEVMQGIIQQVPEFKRYNQEGMVRMYDLFSKHQSKDGMVLKEGHRIFNIEDRADFKRFQSDIVFILEDLVTQYGGGIMIINSLSPLITQVDQNDLMKFLQILIARSKSYKFTNILDMAAGVHPESVENSIEYLMDGIVEFRERDNRNSLRLKGFRSGVLTKDWVDYRHTNINIELVGSFMEERIL
ncbi:MAG: ATPase domain-containing protein [Thermoplasmatota archaeon]